MWSRNTVINNSIGPVSALLLGTVLAYSGPVAAQDGLNPEESGLDEIVITARKREENLMEIPVSVSVINSDFIESSNLLSVNDIAAVTPGFKVNNAFGRQGDRPLIRGVSGISTGVELAGYFVDGVYVSGTLTSFDLEEIDRVEVLRGPQSATFGRRTFAGAVNYVTSAPDEDTHFRVRAELGSNGRQVLGATFSGKTGIVGYRVHARNYSYDGDFDNTLAIGPDNIGSEETQSINASLYLTPSESTTIQVNALYADDDDGQYAIVLQPSSDNNCAFPRPPTQSPGGDRPYYCGTLRDDVPVSLGGLLPDEAYGVQQERFRSFVKLDHDFGEVGLQWISSFNSNNYYAGQDQSFAGLQTAFSFATFGQVPATDWHTIGVSETESSSHEIWLRGLTAGGRLNWGAGLYYFDEETTDSNATLEEVTNTAIMGSVEYDFSEAFRLGLELRYAEDDISIGGPFDETFDSLTHRFTAQWFVNEDAMTYFNWSTGTLPGSFNTDPDLLPDNANLIPVDEGELEQFELGLKMSVSDDLDFVAALYTQEWTNQQRSQFIIINGTPVGYQANEGTTDFRGIELSANWSPLSNLMVNAAVTFNDSEINNFVSDDTTDEAITGDGNVSGNRVPLAADTEAYLGITLDSSFSNGFELRSRLDFSYQGSRYVRSVNRAETGAETIVNATFTLQNGGDWRTTLWGRNLTDEQAPVSALRYIEADSFFFSGRAFALTPRPGPEFGVTASIDFL